MFILLIGMLALVNAHPENPSIITIAPDLILMQCTPDAKVLLNLQKCTIFEPRNRDCVGKDKYTLTEIGGCTPEMNEYIQSMKDPFDPYHGSLVAENFNEPMILKWYKDPSEREEL